MRDSFGGIMKRFFALSLAAGLVLFAGCNSNSGDPEGDSSKTVTSQEAYRYQFNLNGCDTHPRLAISTAQLCRNLQFEGANAGCARSLRRAHFDEACLGQTWDPDATATAIKEQA